MSKETFSHIHVVDIMIIIYEKPFILEPVPDLD